MFNDTEVEDRFETDIGNEGLFEWNVLWDGWNVDGRSLIETRETGILSFWKKFNYESGIFFNWKPETLGSRMRVFLQSEIAWNGKKAF